MGARLRAEGVGAEGASGAGARHWRSSTGRCCRQGLPNGMRARAATRLKQRRLFLELDRSAMRVSQVKCGPPGGGRCGRRSCVPGGGAARGWGRRGERAAARVAWLAGVDVRASLGGWADARGGRALRLNAHLSSIVSSRRSSFCMPVELLARACWREEGSRRGGSSRLSSFGFSGTIAHGAFALAATICSAGFLGVQLQSLFRTAISHSEKWRRRLALLPVLVAAGERATRHVGR